MCLFLVAHSREFRVSFFWNDMKSKKTFQFTLNSCGCALRHKLPPQTKKKRVLYTHHKLYNLEQLLALPISFSQIEVRNVLVFNK